MIFSFSARAAEVVTLNERKVMEIALEKNLEIKTAQTDQKISETGIPAAQSVFDTQLKMRADHLIDKNDQAIPVFGTDNSITNFNFGVEKTFSIGTRTRAEWLNHRESTNSPFATLNPYWENALGLSLEQPFLKNFAGRVDRGGVSLARERYRTASATTQRRILEAVYRSILVYWKWQFDLENLSLTRATLEQARRFEEVARLQNTFALNETTDVVSAQAQRMRIENEVTQAERTREVSLLRLREILNLESEVTLKSGEKIPPPQKVPPEDQALAEALQKRQDLMAALSFLESKRIERMIAKNKKWPELDLVASLQLNGVDTGYGQTLLESIKADHPAFLIGTQFRWLIENRQAKSDFTKAELEKVKALYALKQLENQISREVKEALKELKSREKEVANLKKVEALELKKWQLELQKYLTGRSSSDLVTRYQDDYLKAQRERLASLYFFRKAWLDLKAAMNDLLPEEEMQIQNPKH